MSNKKKDYWQKRFELLEEAQNRKGAEFMEDVERIYNRAIRETEKEISEWYVRFAKKEGISLTEAKRLLNTRELKEFRMTVEEYIEKGKTLNISDTWAKELERASSKVHVSRLEALKVQMQQQVETLTAFKGDEIDDLMRDIYTDSYYKTAFEVQKGIGVGWEVHRLDVDSVNKTLAKPWAADGSNFSQRIWGKQRPELIKRLHDGLTINLAKGESPDKLIKQISHEFNVDKSKAARLVYTEKAYFQTLAELDSLKKLGVEEYEICATLDSRTSPMCREMDGKHFLIKDFQVGATAPPFHCYCRTCLVPYFDDEFTADETRAARDKDGKYYNVPSDMKYKEWKETFVDADGKDFKEKVDKYGLKVFTRPVAEAMIQNAMKEIVKLDIVNFPSAFQSKTEKKNTQMMIDYVNNLEGADPNVLKLYNNMGKLEPEDLDFTIKHNEKHWVREWGSGKVEMSICKLDGDDLTGQVSVNLHEEMHLMDLYGRKDGKWFSMQSESLVNAVKNTDASMSDEVKKICEDFKSEIKKVQKETLDKYNEMYFNPLSESYKNREISWESYKKQFNKAKKSYQKELDYVQRNAMGGAMCEFQDIYDALSKGRYRDTGVVYYGHGSYFRTRGIEGQVHEIVANYSAISIVRPDLAKLFKADKPELAAELDKLIEEMLKKVGE